MSSTSRTASYPSAPGADELDTAELFSRNRPIFELRHVGVWYGDSCAVADVDLQIGKGEITAFIGPSGCGKSTVLRTLNCMNALVPGARVTGSVRYRGVDLYGPGIAVTEVRRRIGMVFQKPTCFPRSIFENVAFGVRLAGSPRRAIRALVERSLQRVGLWDEVKDRLHGSALALSGGQQQRLCIARAIAVEPEVLLMDEPCSALDPIATATIEALMLDLKRQYTLVVVTHNMQQARRVSDRTAFWSVSTEGERRGVLVEVDRTETLFAAPRDPRTQAYLDGRVG